MRFLLFIFCIFTLQTKAQELSYYLPASLSYNKSIPTPDSIIGHRVGEWHITHDKLVQYMRVIDQASDRVVLRPTGTTYEGRPQLVLVITSPANHQNLEQIRLQHSRLSDPAKSADLNTATMPSVVWIGCSIHGNEPSGANASLLAAYYLAAAQGKQIDSLLDHTVILLDPAFNPDGLQRFATWVNMHKSSTSVTDPFSREFNEVWPGGRFNHYWFDLNRDWLPAVHHESRNRLVVYHDWKPNILTDHHEMGTQSSFFFQPGVPSRVNANTPAKNQELTGKIAEYHARYLDQIGSLYFTKEGYDDYYYGKGSTYPDVNGGIGILFEQASSRGHAQQSNYGTLTFPFTIRNQFTTMLSTLEAGRQLRVELLNYQREFYVQARKEATASPVKGWVFGDPADPSRNRFLLDLLRRHQIEVYELSEKLDLGGKTFQPGNAWLLPAQQPQFKLIKSMFEKNFQFQDSIFYDISAWTIPLAFGIPYSELQTWNPRLVGARVHDIPAPSSSVVKSQYAYIIEWQDYYAPYVLHKLQSAGLRTRVAQEPFEVSTTAGNRKFSRGSIMLPVQNQSKTPDEIFTLLQSVRKDQFVPVHSISSGFSVSGVDLGSSSFASLSKPNIMIFGGAGTSPTDVGEVWFLLDQRYGIPASIVDVQQFNQIEPARYNVIVMPGGQYNTLNQSGRDKLRNWVQQGGTLIATEDAVEYLANNGFTKVRFRKDSTPTDTTTTLPYARRIDAVRALDNPGSIYEARLELTHPLAYGYTRPEISMFKSNNLFMDKNNSPYSSPVQLNAKPLQAGYQHPRYTRLASGAASVNIDLLGQGRIVSMTENPNFRAFWYGTNRLLMNAIFFGQMISRF